MPEGTYKATQKEQFRIVMIWNIQQLIDKKEIKNVDDALKLYREKGLVSGLENLKEQLEKINGTNAELAVELIDLLLVSNYLDKLYGKLENGPMSEARQVYIEALAVLSNQPLGSSYRVAQEKKFLERMKKLAPKSITGIGGSPLAVRQLLGELYGKLNNAIVDKNIGEIVKNYTKALDVISKLPAESLKTAQKEAFRGLMLRRIEGLIDKVINKEQIHNVNEALNDYRNKGVVGRLKNLENQLNATNEKAAVLPAILINLVINNAELDAALERRK